MKNFLVFIFVAVSATAYSQALSPDVISTSGTSFTSGSSQLDWTLGETTTADFSTGSDQLTQGFHQPELLITAIGQLPGVSVSVYPNPVLTALNVQLEIPDGAVIKLFSVDGKLLHSENAANKLNTLKMESFAAGNYLLVISSKGGQASSFRISKIN